MQFNIWMSRWITHSQGALLLQQQQQVLTGHSFHNDERMGMSRTPNESARCSSCAPLTRLLELFSLSSSPREHGGHRSICSLMLSQMHKLFVLSLIPYASYYLASPGERGGGANELVQRCVFSLPDESDRKESN